jgi:hypothetical protein
MAEVHNEHASYTPNPADAAEYYALALLAAYAEADAKLQRHRGDPSAEFFLQLA